MNDNKIITCPIILKTIRGIKPSTTPARKLDQKTHNQMNVILKTLYSFQRQEQYQGNMEGHDWSFLQKAHEGASLFNIPHCIVNFHPRFMTRFKHVIKKQIKPFSFQLASTLYLTSLYAKQWHKMFIT